MRILYFTTLKENNDTNMGQWQVVHFINELRNNGWIVDLYFPDDTHSIDEVNELLMRHVIDSRPDLFLSVFNEQTIYPETLLRIADLSVPTVLICFDNLVIPFEHKKIAKYYSIVWLTSGETEYLFKSWGANTIYLPYAANPNIIINYNGSSFNNRIAFVGTPYGARKYLLSKIAEKKLPIDIYGNVSEKNNSRVLAGNNKRKVLLDLLSFPIGRKLLWGTFKYRFLTKDCSPESETVKHMCPVPVSEIPIIYSEYALSLSSTSARNTEVLKNPVPIINLRSFEIPMSYGLQICRYNEELAKYFDENKEIVFYRDYQELVDKALFYLNPDNYAIVRDMKIAARRRAENEHTWTNRFNSLMLKIKSL